MVYEAPKLIKTSQISDQYPCCTSGCSIWHLLKIDIVAFRAIWLSCAFTQGLAVGINLSTTALIILKINLVTRHNPSWGSYRRIVWILVESVALSTSLVMTLSVLKVANAIKPFDLDTAGGKVVAAINQYAGAILAPMAVKIYNIFK